MIFNFEVTNLDTMQIYRFDKAIHQKERLPIVGELQRSALVYLFEKKLVDSVSETSAKINPDGDLVTMQVTGETERFFVKAKCEEGSEEGAEGISSEDVQMKLQAYEDTGLTPDEVANVEKLFQMRNEQVARMIGEIEHLKKIIENAKYILGKEDSEE